MTDSANWPQHLAALYEVKRQAFLIGYLQNPDKFSDALAFAYEHRLSPIFHEDGVREAHDGDPFEEAYVVKGALMAEVLKYVDDRDLAGDYQALEFYNLEEKFGGRTNRIALIYTLEYARIDGRFNDKVWNAVESNAPAEANSIDSDFGPEKVSFY